MTENKGVKDVFKECEVPPISTLTGQRFYIRLSGALTATSDTIIEFRQQSHAALETPLKANDYLVVDIAEVTRVDSAGYLSLLSSIRAVRQLGSDLMLIAPTPAFQAIIRPVMLDGYCRVFDSQEMLQLALQSHYDPLEETKRWFGKVQPDKMTNSSSFSIRQTHEHLCHHIEVAGSLDINTSVLLTQMIKDIVANHFEQGHLLVVDMNKVSYLDSSGLGSLLLGLKRVHALSGKMVLIVTSERIKAVLSNTGLNHHFTVVDSKTQIPI